MDFFFACSWLSLGIAYDIVETKLKEFVKAFRRSRLCNEGLCDILTELTLRNPVSNAHLLFLKHLLTVLADTAAAAAGTLVSFTSFSGKCKLLRLCLLKDTRAESFCNFVSWSSFHSE